MKKFLLLFILVNCLPAFSQSITVNTTTYTVPELVTNILVNKPCVAVNNITWSTGTNFGSTNGIGYFQNTNPAFPLQNGVILSTGNVMNAPGPNNSQLNDGNAAWTGDADLEATLLASGITMNSTNATVLEFDFTPFSPNFNFQFLFASEEYGTFQCLFSDAFAFLLTNTSTGVTENIAVVPSTTTPISVETIRDFLYNSSCPSANASYFGSFNGGSAAATSATNYNGQTVVMNASSVLTPNITYHIKLVIADREDNEADSAIFLGANSFNVGQDVLGQDLTVANNTAICEGQNTILTTGLDSSVFSFEWFQDGILLPAETGPTLTINQAGVYSVRYTIISSNCVVTTDFLNVESYDIPITPDPIDLFLCDSGQANYTFDLGINTAIVGVPNISISYHASQFDADNNASPLPTNYTVPAGNIPATVYMRIQNTTNSCFTTKSFQLALSPPPTSQTPWVYSLCETGTGTGTAIFWLPSQNTIALNGASATVFTVSYYTNSTDAANGTNPIDISTFYTSGNTTIYVRVENNTDTNCSTLSNFNLIVIPTPNIIDIPDQYVCTSFTLPVLALGNYYTGPFGSGTILNAGDVIAADQLIYIYYATGTTPSCVAQTSFTVTIVDVTEIAPPSATYCDQYLIEPWTAGTTYWTNGPGGPNLPGNTQIPVGTAITTNGQVIWTHFVGTEIPTPCILDSNFTVNINITPTLAPVSNQFDCVSYILPPIAVGNYYTGPGGTGTIIPAGTPILSTMTVYVFADNLGCTTSNGFTVYIDDVTAPDVEVCTQYIVTVPPIGEYRSAPNGGGFIYAPGTIITANTTIYTYVPTAGTPNCTDNDFFTVTISQPTLVNPVDPHHCGTYLLPVNIDGGRYFTLAGGPATIGNVELFPNVDSITTSTTIYIYKESTTLPGCYNEKPWTITINQKPIIDSRGDLLVCISYNLTPLVNGSYYDDPNGVNPITDLTIDIADLNATDDLVNSAKIIYVYAASPADPSCFTETSFRIEFDGLAANPIPSQLTYCDSFTLPALIPNNFYYNASGGPHGGGSIIPVGTVLTDSTLTPIYIYTETNNRLPCSDEKSFMITIVDTPVLAPPVTNVINACHSFTLDPLTVGKYYTLSGGPSVAGNTEIIAPITYSSTNPAPAVIYAYADSGTINPNCTVEEQIRITLFNVTELQNVIHCQNYTLPALPAGQGYYLSPGGVNPIPSTFITVTQPVIYIFGNSGFTPTCSDESSFSVTIVPTPVANSAPITNRTVCDEDGVNDGVTSFNLTSLNAFILGTQTGAEFTVAYYESLNNANTQTSPVTTTLLPLVYARVNNTLAIDCYALQPISIIVNTLPEPVLAPEYFICEDHETGTLLNPVVLNTGLGGTNYLFEWTLDGVDFGGNTAAITANVIGTYAVTVTNLTTTCKKTISTEVSAYAPYIEIIYSDAFENPPYITVNVLGAGSGNYEYQLDGGPFQDSAIFYDVTSGEHTVNVRDKSGTCSPAPSTAVIIKYPKYFTPNGDGYHDTWNILDLQSTNPNAPIFIFDRFGKLIKQITPASSGWDGTFNGNPLPSTDYWFTVDYTEKGASKTFKAHFALKR